MLNTLKKHKDKLFSAALSLVITFALALLMCFLFSFRPANASEVFVPSAITLLPAEQLKHVTNATERFERIETIEGATELLKSTEGPAWEILSVRGPACTTEKGKACRDIKNKCAVSTKFATKHKKHAVCSALYKTSTVLLTTAPRK